MTEKHHCQTLLVMQRVFVDSIQKYFNDRALERMFPRMAELTELHTNFLKKLRQRQHQYYIVDSIADILLEFFSALSAQRLKSAYGGCGSVNWRYYYILNNTIAHSLRLQESSAQTIGPHWTRSRGT